MAKELIQDPAGEGTGPLLEVRILSGSRAGEVIALRAPEIVRFGRNPDAEVAFSRTADVIVSHRHAEVRREHGGYALYDVGSTNGVLRVPGGERIGRMVLPPTCEIELGPGGPRCRITITPGGPAADLLDARTLPPGAATPSAEEAQQVTVPFGKYVLTGRLGMGGMAELYLARQRGLGGFERPAVLKLIRPELYELPGVAAMLLDEARIIAEISHPNVVQVHDVGEEQGVLYIAMEYLRGTTLHLLSAQVRRAGVPLPPDLWAALIAQACEGLHAAHELRDPQGHPRHVVHRDVSPSNIMMLPEGQVKLIDFGVARAEGRLSATAAGQIKGKLAYMAPEQLDPQARPVDRRADLFSAGVVLFELCTGQRLFLRENDMATVIAVTQGQVPPLRSLCREASPLLEQIVMSALSPDPQARPPTAAAMAEGLWRVAGGRFVSPQQVARYLEGWGVSLSGPPPRPLLRSPLPLAPPLSASTPPRPPPPSSGGAPQGLRPPHPAEPGEPPPVPVPVAAEITAPTEEDSPAPAPPTPPAPAPVPLPRTTPLTPVVAAPPRELRTQAGRRVLLAELTLDEARDRDPLPLPLPAGRVLPAPLLVSVGVGSLIVEVARQPATAEGAPRPPAIYLDARAPATRRESHVITGPLRDAHFEVGHRRARVQRVQVCSTASDTGPADLSLSVPELDLDLVAPRARLLALLYTCDAEDDTVHAACITLV